VALAVALLSLALLAGPLAAEAQPGRVYRIGYPLAADPEGVKCPTRQAFTRGPRELGRES
jgi:hypothetical protein